MHAKKHRTFLQRVLQHFVPSDETCSFVQRGQVTTAQQRHQPPDKTCHLHSRQSKPSLVGCRLMPEYSVTMCNPSRATVPLADGTMLSSWGLASGETFRLLGCDTDGAWLRCCPSFAQLPGAPLVVGCCNPGRAASHSQLSPNILLQFTWRHSRHPRS